MSNKAITTNDLKAVLDVVLPPTPSEYRKLLWSNPNPSSSFAAQTVSLNLSDYDEVEVICKPHSSHASYFASRVKVGNKGMLYSQTGYGSPVRIYGTQRNFTPTSTGVAFGDGLDFSASVSNAYCVPYQIYGIKYDRVNPPVTEDATFSNGVLSFGNFRVFFGAKDVASTGTATITFPTGTFSQVVGAVPYCGQNGFGAYDTVSITNLSTTSVTLYQFNSAGATMRAAVAVFGLA